MNENWLESLLSDQALQALSFDVERLLQAYLKDHPEYLSLSESIHQTAALAQQAVTRDLPRDLPAFPMERFVRQPERVRRPSWQGWKAMAACLVIGLGIGLSFRYSMRKDLTPGPSATTAQVSVDAQPLAESGDVTRAFWSVKTYQNRYRHYPAGTRSKTNLLRYQKYGKGGLL